MTNHEYMRAVERHTYPDDPEVPIDEPFRNDAGTITNLVLGKFGGGELLVCNEGSIRSNHWHRSDWHYLYVLAGEVWYYWLKLGAGNDETKRRVFTAGQMFFTP